MTATETENGDAGKKAGTIQEPEPPMPLDGGWGWMVVFASLLCNVIVDGVCFTFGIFYVEFLDYYGESKSKTAWVGSLVPGMYLSIGPIVSALANKYGCRSVTMIGSFLATISFFASTFSPNINWLIFTYGICGGISFGLMYLPSIVIVGYYFDKKRAFATGLAVCGSGIGTFLFAPLGGYLLKLYGWKGAYWIISGIILHGVCCGLLFRPLEQNRPPRKRHESDPKDPIDHGVIMNKIIEHKSRERQISTGTLNGALITKDNELISNKERVEKIMADYKQQGGYQPPTGSTPDLHTPSHDLPPLVESSQSIMDLTVGDSGTPNAPNMKPKHIQVTRLLSTESGARKRTVSGSMEGGDNASRHDSETFQSRESLRKREVARPLYRHDIFYAGSVTSIPEYMANPDMASYVESVTSVPQLPEDEDPNSCRARCLPLVTVLKDMLDFSLLKSPTFVLLCAASVLAMTGFFTPFVYITAYSLELGVPVAKATLLLSVLGLFNTLGRILSGWLSDQKWTDCILIHNWALVLAGLSTCAVPFITYYPVICVYCAVFGSCIAAFVALRSIVLVELLGVQKLSNSFGLLLLFQGIASIVGSPFCGALYDWSGSYSISFLASGGLIALAGVICMPVRYVARWERRRHLPPAFTEPGGVNGGSKTESVYSRLSNKETPLNNNNINNSNSSFV